MDFAEARRYFWSVFGVIGVVMVWAGIWEGLGGLPYLESPLLSLLLGSVMLLLAGFFNQTLNPLQAAERSVNRVLHLIKAHPKKHEFHLRYHDHLRKKAIQIRMDTFRGIEKGAFLVLHDPKKGEIFIPAHRVREILHKGKTYWKP